MGRFGLLESLGSYCNVYFVPVNLRFADLSINSLHLHQLKIVHLVVRQKVFLSLDVCVNQEGHFKLQHFIRDFQEYYEYTK